MDLINYQRHTGRQPLHYARPQYEEAAAQLRTTTGRDYSRQAQRLRMAGVPEADIPRMLTDQIIGAQGQSSSLYNQALDMESQLREQRKAQRRNRLGRLLGLAIDIPSRIWQFKLLSKSLSGGQRREPYSPLSGGYVSPYQGQNRYDVMSWMPKLNG